MGITANIRYLSGEGEIVHTRIEDADQLRIAHGMPVRRIPSRSRQPHHPGFFWSAANNGHVPYETRLGLNRLWLADFDHTVTRIAAQPFGLSGPDGGILRQHVPDLFLLHKDGTVTVVDVKPAALLTHKDVAAVLTWTKQLCETRGWRHHIWSGANPSVLANIRWLGQARRPSTANQHIPHVVKLCKPGTTISQLTEAAAKTLPASTAKYAILAALWFGALTTILHQPITDQSPLAIGTLSYA